jgi:AmmeMemoRadiSam system protein B
MRRPRLIAIEPQPFPLEDGTTGIALRDPLGVVRETAVLSPAAWWLVSRFDGRRTAADLVDEAAREGLSLEAAEVESLAARLEGAGFLHGPAHEALRARAAAEFRALGTRPPSCAGSVYPADAARLRAALDGWLAAAPPAHGAAAARVLVAPHIDYHRGGAGYAIAYRALEACEADLFVVFGTAHASPPHLFTLTRLDYDTPLGPVRTDRAVVDALSRALGEEEVFADELAHRDEHSCELQMPWLLHVRRGRPFTAVPVLCSTVSHLPDAGAATARFLGALSRAVEGRRVCYVAAADLAHVGPRYGDLRPPTRAELSALEADDRRTLGFVEAGDAPGFHREAVRDDARRRVCGVAPIYAALRASGAPARVLHYAQWTDGTDSVSYAAAAG